jgi:hypothetical protein
MVVLHMKLKTGTQNKVKSPHISFLVSLVIILDSYFPSFINCLNFELIVSYNFASQFTLFLIQN